MQKKGLHIKNSPHRKWLFAGFGVFLLVSVILLCYIFSSTLAYMTDNQQVTMSAQAGTVQINGPNIQFLPSDSNVGEPVISGNKITVWDPGDINIIQWQVDNLGNKSVDLRYQINLYWNEGPGMLPTDNEPTDSPLWEEKPYVYLYPATLTDEEIRADMESATPSKYIAIGNSDVEYHNSDGATRYGYSFMLNGVTLDGVGENAETGDATIPGGTSDLVQYKIALSLNTPAGYMGRTLQFDLQVEAQQHRNTASN